MNVAEPMTVLTDALVAACGLGWGLRLAGPWRATGPAEIGRGDDDGPVERGQAQRRAAVGWWGVGFFAIAAAAAAGGAWHGWSPVLAERAAWALWKVTLLAAGLVGFAVLAATIASFAPRPWRRPLIALAAAKLAAYAGWMLGHDDFVWVIADYGSSLLVALVANAAAWWRRRAAGAAWIVGGILVSFLGAGVQASGFALHRHFNHNDLYHVIQIAGLWLLYRGARLARDGGARA